MPGEPAAWSNWGILALRQGNFDAAAERFNRALSLDRGNSAQAISDLREAVKRNPRNLRALYQLASEVERQGDEHRQVDVEQLMQQLLNAPPDDLAALLDLSRIAAKRGDTATLRSAVGRIQA